MKNKAQVPNQKCRYPPKQNSEKSSSQKLKNNEEKPKKGKWIEYKIDDEDEWMKAKTMNKQPKPKSKDSSYVNIISELKVAGSINWNYVKCWREVTPNIKSNKNPNDRSKSNLNCNSQNTTVTNNTAIKTKDRRNELKKEIKIKLKNQNMVQNEENLAQISKTSNLSEINKPLLSSPQTNREKNLTNFKNNFNLKIPPDKEENVSDNYQLEETDYQVQTKDKDTKTVLNTKNETKSRSIAETLTKSQINYSIKEQSQTKKRCKEENRKRRVVKPSQSKISLKPNEKTQRKIVQANELNASSEKDKKQSKLSIIFSNIFHV